MFGYDTGPRKIYLCYRRVDDPVYRDTCRTQLFICLWVSLFARPSLPVRLFVCMSVCLSVCLSVCQSVSAGPNVCLVSFPVVASGCRS
jgi:hypothetical protein